MIEVTQIAVSDDAVFLNAIAGFHRFDRINIVKPITSVAEIENRLLVLDYFDILDRLVERDIHHQVQVTTKI